MQTAVFDVVGMHCNGCVRSVTNALNRTAGVKSAEVSLSENSARIGYDEKETNPDVLRKSILEAGYDVES